MTSNVARAANDLPTSTWPLLVAPLLLLVLAASVQAGPLFSAPFLSYDTAHGPSSAAIGDLNSDGIADIVTGNNSNTGTISVFLGTADGSFGTRIDLAGATAASVAIGDLNGDGKPDLVASGGQLSVWLGNGDGSFGTRTDLIANGPSVAIGDLNGDGKSDLAVASGSVVAVFLGNGDGSFGPRVNYGVGSNASSVAIGDLNADGRPDLAVSNQNSNTVSVLLGNGNGSFGPKTDYGVENVPRSVAIGDLNGDGKPDLAVANQFTNSVSVLLGNGNGTFGLQTAYGTSPAGHGSPFCVAIGDMNTDGRPDLATANLNGNDVSILFGAGDGSFGSVAHIEAAGAPTCVAIGDLNGNGKLDMVVTNSNSHTVTVHSGNGDGSFGAPDFGTGTSPTQVAIGDLNGDGNPDLVTSNYNGRSVSVLLGNGVGGVGPRTDLGIEGNATGVVIGDLNADGAADLAVSDRGDAVSIFLGNGDGTFGARTNYGAGRRPTAIAMGDLNGDGKPDLATPNDVVDAQGNSRVSVLLNNGDGSFGASTEFVTGGHPSTLAIGDLNGDGKLDLVITASALTVLLGNGDGTFGEHTNFSTGAFPQSVAIVDLNGDGKSDLVTANSSSGSVAVLLGDGTGSFGANTEYPTGPSPFSVAIGDLNGDGNLDVVTTNVGTGTVSVLPGSGDGSLGGKTIPDYGTGAGPFSLAIGDLNGDGGVDLVTGNQASHTVSILLRILSCPPKAMTFDFSPNTVNLRSMGHWVTATLEPAPPGLPADIDISSILLNGSVPVDLSAPTSIGDVDLDGRPDLTVRFDREAVELTVTEGQAVPVTITGHIESGCFEAVDTIRVIRGRVTAPIAGSVLQGGGSAEVRWDTPAGVHVQSVAVLSSSDDGSTWNLVAHDLPNTGNYLWTVPGTATDQGRIAVVLVESADPSGDEVLGVLGVSDRFVIVSPLAVDGSSLELSLLGSVSNPSRDLSVSFALPDAKPSKLVVYDVSGREVSRREVGSLGAGRHTVTLGASGTVAPGFYLVHLTRGERRLVARLVIVQ